MEHNLPPHKSCGVYWCGSGWRRIWAVLKMPRVGEVPEQWLATGRAVRSSSIQAGTVQQYTTGQGEEGGSGDTVLTPKVVFALQEWLREGRGQHGVGHCSVFWGCLSSNPKEEETLLFFTIEDRKLTESAMNWA